ncbi:MAG: lysophospholipid acyltransferase family protein [Myxococcota bacterium]|jgi:KDO2-lipid IV(A) lauroyltransferase
MRKRLKRAVRYVFVRALVGLLGLLPLRLASGLGAVVGRLSYALARRERRKALASLERAFPEKSPAEREALARACFAHLGRMALELVCVKQLDRRVDEWVDWTPESRAAFDAALARKKGVVFVTGHVGNWELLARRAGLAGYPVFTIAREASDPRTTALIERFRTSGGVRPIWRGRPSAAKEMLRALKNGAFLGLLIDQDTKVQSVWVPFFGHLAKTPRAAADLALRTGAAVLTGFCHRVAPHRYRIVMREVPLPPGDSDAAVTDLTATLTKAIEDAIREHPEQWVWMHERWKSPPEPSQPTETTAPSTL